MADWGGPTAVDTEQGGCGVGQGRRGCSWGSNVYCNSVRLGGSRRVDLSRYRGLICSLEQVPVEVGALERGGSARGKTHRAGRGR